MHYKVTKQYTRGGESDVAEFNDISDSKLFIEAKIALDASLKVKIIYRLYEMLELIQTFDPDQMDTTGAQGGSGEQGNAASFRPTPLNTSPRPAGAPSNWIINPKDDDIKK